MITFQDQPRQKKIIIIITRKNIQAHWSMPIIPARQMAKRGHFAEKGLSGQKA
jgi:hypothetical protein